MYRYQVPVFRFYGHIAEVTITCMHTSTCYKYQYSDFMVTVLLVDKYHISNRSPEWYCYTRHWKITEPIKSGIRLSLFSRVFSTKAAHVPVKSGDAVVLVQVPDK